MLLEFHHHSRVLTEMLKGPRKHVFPTLQSSVLSWNRPASTLYVPESQSQYYEDEAAIGNDLDNISSKGAIDGRYGQLRPRSARSCETLTGSGYCTCIPTSVNIHILHVSIFVIYLQIRQYRHTQPSIHLRIRRILLFNMDHSQEELPMLKRTIYNFYYIIIFTYFRFTSRYTCVCVKRQVT